jgi:hypothetical protein
MKLKFRMFVIHRTATSLQRTDNLNPRIRWYPALDESNRMKSAYFTMHPGKILLLKMVVNWNPVFLKALVSHSPLFPIQPDFSQNKSAATTLNIGSPWTLIRATSHTSHESWPPELWEPNGTCPKAVPWHLQNHVVRSRTLERSVKSYVIGHGSSRMI